VLFKITIDTIPRKTEIEAVFDDHWCFQSDVMVPTLMSLRVKLITYPYESECMSLGNSAKEDIPGPREYRCLKRAAAEEVDNQRYDTDDFRLQCQFVLRMMGELGMRGGEVVHLSEDWVNFEQNEIVIPSHDPCTKADDGGPCGYCKKRARSKEEHSEEISYERALRDRWEPKNEAGNRTIWFGWNDELVELIDEFLYRFNEYPHSRASVNRRITTIAEECDMVDPEDVYPHALRAHAAKNLAKDGMRVFQLKEFFGWSDVGGAMDYVEMASGDVKSELKRVYNIDRF